jgi:hypothetical protein
MKRVISVLIILAIAFNMTGCDRLQRKFTRKKKETVKMPRIYQVQKYQKVPSPELYKKHYSYWGSFHSEMEMTLGQNHKKDKVNIEHIISNLRDMEGILIPEKAEILDNHIKKLLVVKDTIEKEELSQFNRTYIMSTLGREGRFIKREFCYDKIKSFLRTSFDSPTIEAPLNVDSGQGQEATNAADAAQ